MVFIECPKLTIFIDIVYQSCFHIKCHLCLQKLNSISVSNSFLVKSTKGEPRFFQQNSQDIHFSYGRLEQLHSVCLTCIGVAGHSHGPDSC